MRARRLATFSVLCGLTTILFWAPLKAAIELSLRDDRYVQILVAPFLCLFLIFWERDRVFFPDTAYSPRYGILLLLPVLLVYMVFLHRPPLGNPRTNLCIGVFGAILAWMVVFILCYGIRSFRAALFPLCCLFLMIPPAAELMDHITTGLQNGSAAMSHRMFLMAGIPIFAQGTRFSLPGLVIEVAPECSGIRSTLALSLTALLAGRICLRCGWSRFLLLAMVIPIAILKNAARITVIASLSVYVDRAFLSSPLHRYGGLVFTPLGFALCAAILYSLRRLEGRPAAPPSPHGDAT